VYVLFPQSILDNYRYTDIVTWGHSDEKFILVVGNVVQQRKIVFKTDKVYMCMQCDFVIWQVYDLNVNGAMYCMLQGAQINQLVHDYVKCKMDMAQKASK